VVAECSKRGDEAEAKRFHPSAVGYALHFQSYEVVGEQDAPNLLTDAVGRLAADTLLSLQNGRFDLVVGKLQLPALVVQDDEFFERVCDGIEQRGKESLWLVS